MVVSVVYLSHDRVLDDDMDSLAAVSVYQESDTENQERIVDNSFNFDWLNSFNEKSLHILEAILSYFWQDWPRFMSFY